jgi:hypothetical protein
MKAMMAQRDLPKIDYQAHPLYGGMFAPKPNAREAVLEELKPHLAEIEDCEEYRSRLFGYRYGWNDALSQELAQEGSARRQLTGKVMDRVQAQIQPAIDMVQGRIAAARSAGEPIRYKTALELLSRETHPELWATLDGALMDEGVHQTTTTVFAAQSAKLRSVALLVNHPRQDWATRLWRDFELEAPPTAGFHIDSDGKCLTKMVLYLTDVGAEQGPFGMVPGSHRWGEGARDRIYRCAFDKSGMVVRSAKRRRMFLSLPEEMQTKAEFGGDMIAGSPEAEELLANERVMTGPRGQLNLFNPDSIHRGGNVREGQRHVLLVSLGPRW